MRWLAMVLLLAGPISARAAESAPESVVEQATKAVCDKRVVLLGELPSHGELRGFQLKSEIVRQLVQQCGFRTLVFEAPAYDFLLLSQRWGEGTVTQRQLDDAIGRFWWAKELAHWRGWLFDEAEHGRQTLRGMDDQVGDTAMLARDALPSMVAARVPAERSALCAETVDRHLRWDYDDVHLLDDAVRQRLVECTRDAAAAAAASSTGPDSIEAVSLSNFAGTLQREMELPDAPDRDAVMFRNAALFAGDKTIVWTASVHAAKQQGGRARKPLGTWMAERWGAQVGAIAFTALGGSSSRAGSPPKALEPAPADSLEARLLGPEAQEAFAAADRLHELGAIASRLLGKFQSADWSGYFDGVIVVRDEQAPRYAVPY